MVSVSPGQGFLNYIRKLVQGARVIGQWLKALVALVGNLGSESTHQLSHLDLLFRGIQCPLLTSRPLCTHTHVCTDMHASKITTRIQLK